MDQPRNQTTFMIMANNRLTNGSERHDVEDDDDCAVIWSEAEAKSAPPSSAGRTFFRICESHSEITLWQPGRQKWNAFGDRFTD